MPQELLQTKKSLTFKSVRIDLIMHNDMNNTTKQHKALNSGKCKLISVEQLHSEQRLKRSGRTEVLVFLNMIFHGNKKKIQINQ